MANSTPSFFTFCQSMTPFQLETSIPYASTFRLSTSEKGIILPSSNADCSMCFFCSGSSNTSVLSATVSLILVSIGSIGLPSVSTAPSFKSSSGKLLLSSVSDQTSFSPADSTVSAFTGKTHIAVNITIISTTIAFCFFILHV